MKGAGAHFHVIGLMDHTPAVGPKSMQGQDELLKGHACFSGIRSVRWLSGIVAIVQDTTSWMNEAKLARNLTNCQAMKALQLLYFRAEMPSTSR